MAGYTLVNLNEVEDLAPKFGLTDFEARFATVPLELQKSGISLQRYGPGVRLPFGHKHDQQEELYVVVSGSGRIKLNDEVVELKQWDAVRIPGDTMRNFQAGPEGAELLAFGAPNTGPSVAADVLEQVPGWWSD
ncbi:MAG: cupin domain-containing protein [Solirubrobacterales bacterium]